MRVIAGIEDPAVIEKILAHQDSRLPPGRAPPAGLFAGGRATHGAVAEGFGWPAGRVGP